MAHRTDCRRAAIRVLRRRTRGWPAFNTRAFAGHTRFLASRSLPLPSSVALRLRLVPSSAGGVTSMSGTWLMAHSRMLACRSLCRFARKCMSSASNQVDNIGSFRPDSSLNLLESDIRSIVAGVSEGDIRPVSCRAFQALLYASSTLANSLAYLASQRDSKFRYSIQVDNAVCCCGSSFSSNACICPCRASSDLTAFTYVSKECPLSGGVRLSCCHLRNFSHLTSCN